MYYGERGDGIHLLEECISRVRLSTWSNYLCVTPSAYDRVQSLRVARKLHEPKLLNLSDFPSQIGILHLNKDQSAIKVPSLA
ncbi:hypothetical protein AMATHDRAFT_60980 [Amanita thiersii Skay4041]|uniref:Uncharacterized protein n=1 Tax=Amanita thiersii Skay4041 TaxID=703135 RepID=A0A2A9NRV5_9AGAR|nr:hypothetical protein AMATHDRAFT_60980 [Amanita thiersii Skay4041]